MATGNAIQSAQAPGTGTGTVTSVTATDTSIVIGGTAAAPTVATGTLDVIAADHPPAAAWSNNSQQIHGLANGSAAQDAAAFGQVPTSAGSIGGLLAANNLSDVAAQQTALNNLAGAVTSRDFLRGNGTNVAMAAIQAADVPTLNQNTTGTASNITDTLDQVPAPAANWSNNSHKITSLANGSAASDAAAFGQIPVLTVGAASAAFKPANPASTTSTTVKMMGLGSTCAFTPAGTGNLLITVTGILVQTAALTTISPRYGTGTAPANAAAASGTVWGMPSAGTWQAGGQDPFAFTDIVSLTPATAYWFDLAIATANAADAASITNISMTITELGW